MIERTIIGAMIVVGAVAAVVAFGDFGRSSGGDEAAAAEPAVVGCATHVEPSVKRFERRRDVVRGPFALVTVRQDLPRISQRSYRPRNGRLAGIKLPIGLRARHTATLSVAASQRAHATLIFRDETRATTSTIEDGDSVVAFKPCPANTPAFSDGGVVGPITGWAGALNITGPRCIRLEIRVDGERLRDIRLPLGRRCT